MVERSGTSWVSTRVHSWVEEGQQDMVVGKGEEGNNMVPHTLADIDMYHTWVVAGCMDCGVLWYQSIHPLSETFLVCLGQMEWVLWC